jgi:AcrR family transcriptional regulator
MPRRAKDDGRTTRWDAHRDQRRTDLVLAAVRAIDRHGPDASVADMAAEAGVSKPVLYRYFADKDELHAAVGQWGAREVLSRLVPALTSDAPMRQRIADATDGYLATLEEHPQVFLLLVRHRGADALADGKAEIAATLARLLGDTLRDLGIDAAGAEPWSHGLVGLGLSTGEWWLERRTMSRAAVADYLAAFVWHALDGAARDLGVPLSAVDQRTLPVDT